jgi:DNA-directed RNA polymerase specialized sigma24 family protein
VTDEERDRNEYLSAAWPVIRSVGLWMSRRCEAADADDLTQELAIAAVRRHKALRAFVAKARPGRERVALRTWLRSAGRRIAHWQRTGPAARHTARGTAPGFDLREVPAPDPEDGDD